MFLKLHSKSPTVATIIEWLNFLGYRYKKPNGTFELIKPSETFDAKVESMIIDFQETVGIFSDGIVGPITMQHLEEEYARCHIELSSPGIDAFSPDRFPLVTVFADPYEDGYTKVKLRGDVAEAYNKVRREVTSQGGILTSSGTMRSLHANVSSNRSATSFHYVGLALDLMIHSGMSNPKTDPYVVCYTKNRYFNVYARCKDNWNFNPFEERPKLTLPPEIELDNVVTYGQRNHSKTKPVVGRFINLTEIFRKHGFERIRARRRFFEGESFLGAEWWHFQHEKSLISKHTSFGSQLLKIYDEETLLTTAPWKHRHKLFGVNWN